MCGPEKEPVAGSNQNDELSLWSESFVVLVKKWLSKPNDPVQIEEGLDGKAGE
jgi:hypothetical protein